eukprot:3220055-Rhodomonas_salina.1
MTTRSRACPPSPLAAPAPSSAAWLGSCAAWARSERCIMAGCTRSWYRAEKNSQHYREHTLSSTGEDQPCTVCALRAPPPATRRRRRSPTRSRCAPSPRSPTGASTPPF